MVILLVVVRCDAKGQVSEANCANGIAWTTTLYRDTWRLVLVDQRSLDGYLPNTSHVTSEKINARVVKRNACN